MIAAHEAGWTPGSPIVGDTRVTHAENAPINRPSIAGAVVWWTADPRRHVTAQVLTAPSRSIGATGGNVGRRRPRVGLRGAHRRQSRRGADQDAAAARFAITSPACMHSDSTGLVPDTERSCVGGHAARVKETRMKPQIQIVGRLPVELSRRVRAAATKQKISLNQFLIEALTRAVADPRVMKMGA